MPVASVLWRRLDVPGHDACSLLRSPTGWRLEGAAVFRYDGVPARLAYEVECDSAWRTERGQVRGRVAGDALLYDIALTSAGLWTINGASVPDLEGCVDLDFGFTPATNLLQIRRLALPVGQSADAPAAWLDVATGTLEVLPQRYERRSEGAYWYDAPSFGYSALLEVACTGFIRRYPGIWEAEDP